MELLIFPFLPENARRFENVSRAGERNPTLDTVLRVIGALGLKLRAEAVRDTDPAGRYSR